MPRGSKKDVIVKMSFGSGESEKNFTIKNRYDILNARLELFDYEVGTVTVLRDGEEVSLTMTRG